MANKYVDLIQIGEIIRLLAVDTPSADIARRVNLSVPTIEKYKKKFKKEIEESRKNIGKIISETGDKVIASRYIEIADICTRILNNNLKKYLDEDKEFKPGELTQVSMIGAIAIDKNRVIENKPTNLNTQPVIFNFKLVQDKSPIKQAEPVITIEPGQIWEPIKVNEVKPEPIETIQEVKPAITEPVKEEAPQSTITNKKATVTIKTTYADGRKVNGVI